MFLVPPAWLDPLLLSVQFHTFFMQFSAKMLPNNRSVFSPNSEASAPQSPVWGNPGSATARGGETKMSWTKIFSVYRNNWVKTYFAPLPTSHECLRCLTENPGSTPQKFYLRAINKIRAKGPGLWCNMKNLVTLFITDSVTIIIEALADVEEVRLRRPGPKFFRFVKKCLKSYFVTTNLRLPNLLHRHLFTILFCSLTPTTILVIIKLIGWSGRHICQQLLVVMAWRRILGPHLEVLGTCQQYSKPLRNQDFDVKLTRKHSSMMRTVPFSEWRESSQTPWM